MIDPVALTAALVACPSVTPRDAGALDVLQKALEGLGFACTRLPFEAPGPERVDNLYARLGEAGPVFGYAGHTDVVPAGDAGAREFRRLNRGPGGAAGGGVGAWGGAKQAVR